MLLLAPLHTALCRVSYIVLSNKNALERLKLLAAVLDSIGKRQLQSQVLHVKGVMWGESCFYYYDQ